MKPRNTTKFLHRSHEGMMGTSSYRHWYPSGTVLQVLVLMALQIGCEMFLKLSLLHELRDQMRVVSPIRGKFLLGSFARRIWAKCLERVESFHFEMSWS